MTANTQYSAPTVGTAGTVSISTTSNFAFQVDNAASEPVFLVGTDPQGNNLLTYPGFEAGSFTSATTGWVESGATGTITQNTVLADTYNGLYSLKLVTSSGNAGAQTQAFVQNVTPGTYVVSFYAMPSVTMNANKFTVTLNNGTSTTCSPASSANLSITSFTRVYCSLAITTNNLTYLTIAQNDSTARTIYIDAVQLQLGTVPTAYEIGTVQIRGVLANPLAIESPSNSTTELQVLNSSAVSLLTVDSTDGLIILGSNSATNTTNQTLLQLPSIDTFTEASPLTNCSTTVDQGGLYYNPASNAVRACLNGSWQDLASTQDLALQLFGVVPNSGKNAGDLIGVSADGTAADNSGGPCKVNYDTGGASSVVYVNSCVAYSGGRQINWAGGPSPTVSNTALFYQNLCFNSSGALAWLGTGSTTFGSESDNNLTTTSSTTYGQPLLCLATVETGSTAGQMLGGRIDDIRTFTTTLKTYATVATVSTVFIGAIIGPSTTAGLDTVDATATSAVDGVVIATNGTNGIAGTPNVVIANNGPQWIIASAGTVGPTEFVTPSTTSGQAGVTTTATTAYNMIGIDLNTPASGCSGPTYGANDCNFSDFVYMDIQ